MTVADLAALVSEEPVGVAPQTVAVAPLTVGVALLTAGAVRLIEVFARLTAGARTAGVEIVHSARTARIGGMRHANAHRRSLRRSLLVTWPHRRATSSRP